MLFRGNPMFLFLPSESKQRVLHPGTVSECTLQDFVSDFEESLDLNVGDELIAYAEVRGKFMQQGAKVTEVRRSDPSSIAAFARVGTAVSAESRQLYRVSAVTSGIIGLVGRSDLGQVVDLNSVGFGLIAAGDYRIGSVLPVTLNYEGKALTTSARVQTVKPRYDGKTRYGFLAVEPLACKELEKMSMTLQRSQLKRMAGAA